MKAKDFYQGGYFTTLMILITFLTVIGEQLSTYGVVVGTTIITIFSIVTKVVICNSVKDGQAADWKAVLYYSIASIISLAITLILYFLAI